MMECPSALKTEFSERRRYGRLAGEFDVEIVLLTGQKAGDQIPGRVINISKEGIGIVTPTDIQVGAQLSLVVYVEEYDSICTGDVVWKKELNGKRLYGLKITRWSYLDPVLEHQLPRS